ncbi:glycoside hydrolase family 95 protein [Peniophora sp. CONT]|nr:glycoside hydrolase family 95 protein [Peniophora sp. CONT]
MSGPLNRLRRGRVLHSLIALAGSTHAAPSGFPKSGNGLWYTARGTTWTTGSLSIGNGYLAAMLPGGTGQEATQLNIESLWTGGPFQQPGYDGQSKPVSDREELAEFVQTSRQAVFASSTGTISAYDSVMGADFTYYGSYAGAGFLISTLNTSGKVGNYVRWLDLDNAVARTQWDDESLGSSFIRTSFCSDPLRACVEHTNATTGLPRLTYVLTPYLEDGLPSPNVTCLDSATLQLRGTAGDPGMLYEFLGRATAVGGNISCKVVPGTNGSANATLEVNGASEAWFTWVGDTEYDMNAGDAAHGFSFKGVDPHEALVTLLGAATGAHNSYEVILQQHVSDYTRIITKFSLDLGQTPDLDTPTDKLYSSYRHNIGNPYIEWLLFNFGRYLLVSSSRGTLPPNLQGKWAQPIHNTWDSDYHANINLQMNYWMAELTNLPEVTQPLWDYMEKTWVPRGQQTALALYNSTTGWVTHDEMNIFGSTGMKGSAGRDESADYPEANAWMVGTHVFDHLDYTHDVAWWQTQGWLLLKGAAQFQLNQLILDKHFNDSTLVVAPCNSPEQSPITFGCAHSQQLIWQLLNAADKGFAASGDQDTAFIDEVRAKRDAMDPGIHIGSWGQLQEWKFEMDKPTNTHRHLSHLVGLYPGYALASYNASLQPSYLPSGELAHYTPDEVFNAVNTSLTHRGNGTGPDGDAGWEKVWRAACWAQLKNPEMFYFELSYAIERNYASNLFSEYSFGAPPFQIDANLGYPAALLNALIQAPDTARLDQPLLVTIFPAFPASKWPSGSISGARIRGGITLDLSWKNGVPAIGTIVVDGSSILSRTVQVNYKDRLVKSFRTDEAATIALSF